MSAGMFDKRIVIKRLTKTSDNYGGTTSTIADFKTVWAHLKETNGNIDIENGRQKRTVEVELMFRKKTADQIDDNDVLQIENVTGTFRINSRFDSLNDFETTIKASKIG